jgi:serpin B
MEKRVDLLCAVAAVLALVGCNGPTGSSAAAGSSGASGSSISAPVTSDAGPPAQLAQVDVARVAAASISQDALDAAVAANNAFAIDLYSRLAPDSGASNVLTSPISASLALTMTYAGAQGQTATEMATALHFDPNAGTAIFDGQNALSQGLAARGPAALLIAQQNAQGGQPAPSASDYELQVVNSVWGEKTYPWAAPFLGILAGSYGTGVYLQDFINQWDQARQTINAWVSDETNDKINNLLPSGSLNITTRMVLVNAIHLKLPWANPFKVAATVPGTFTRSDGTTVSPSFMNQTTTLPYVDDGQAQIVGLPLSGGQVSVVIALPHPGVDLASYEAGLSATSGALSQPSREALVALSAPKATFTSPTFSLATALQAMGMIQAFSPVLADLKGMCPQTPDGRNLYIADVLQKAMIAMQETGVEAAAATAVIVARASAVGAPAQAVPMVVDRPYLIVIVDVPTGAVLFLGHIEDPTAAGGP